MYHLEHPVHLLTSLTLHGHVTGFFMGKLQDFSESHNFPVKNSVKMIIYGKGAIIRGGVLICIFHRSLSNQGEVIYGPSHSKDGHQNSRDCPLLQKT